MAYNLDVRDKTGVCCVGCSRMRRGVCMPIMFNTILPEARLPLSEAATYQSLLEADRPKPQMDGVYEAGSSDANVGLSQVARGSLVCGGIRESLRSAE